MKELIITENEQNVLIEILKVELEKVKELFNQNTSSKSLSDQYNTIYTLLAKLGGK